MPQTCVIIGASHAGGQLAISLRQEGWDGDIVVVSREASLPYHRPPLSKDFLLGEKSAGDLLIRQPAAYADKNIGFRLNTEVTAINRDSKTLSLADGSALAYDKLALALGAGHRRLDIPGADSAGVHYLRTVSEAEQMQTTLGAAEKVVMIGGGYIGLELAACLRKLGKTVTVLEAAPRLLARVTSPEVSGFFQRLHGEEGVSIVTDAIATSISTEAGKATGVTVESGEHYPADAVLVGIGAIPEISLASDACLATSNGIEVNEFAETSDPDIVAIGDCAFHRNQRYPEAMRLESVSNAMESAKTAAATLVGNRRPHAALPWFWSDQYDCKLQIAGLNSGFDQVVIRGDVSNGRSFAAYYLRDGNVIAVDCVNRAKEFASARQALTKGLQLNIDALSDETVEPKDLILAA